jgi:hypothetical protein
MTTSVLANKKGFENLCWCVDTGKWATKQGVSAKTQTMEIFMPIAVIDHKLRDFDAWFALFSANPPPSVGTWRLVRGIDDPNRVHVVGRMDTSEVDAVKEFFATEKMSSVLEQANEMSTTPLEWIWLDEVKPEHS